MTPSSLTHLIPHCPEGAVLIPLSQDLYSIVDADFDLNLKFAAHHSGDGRFYARGRHKDEAGTVKLKYLHRLIAKALPGQYVDHINGDTLDNRRENLRVCSAADNAKNRKKSIANTSGFKGVFRHATNDCWFASIQVDGKQIHIGCFSDTATAARAYDAKARELHGEFACLNFPDESD